MVRGGKGKGKKQSTDEEIVMVSVRRRGRPQKQLIKDDNIVEEDEEEIEKFEEQESEIGKGYILKKQGEGLEIGKKRKRSSKKGENGDDYDSSGKEGEERKKALGFRQIGSRRKNNKPHRAAEVGVECK